MKGGDVGNLLAAASFIGKDLSQDIWVVGTANEELDGKGSEDLLVILVKIGAMTQLVALLQNQLI